MVRDHLHHLEPTILSVLLLDRRMWGGGGVLIQEKGNDFGPSLKELLLLQAYMTEKGELSNYKKKLQALGVLLQY